MRKTKHYIISAVFQSLFSLFITGCHHFSVDYVKEKLFHTEKTQLLYTCEITVLGNIEEAMYVAFQYTCYLNYLMY